MGKKFWKNILVQNMTESLLRIVFQLSNKSDKLAYLLPLYSANTNFCSLHFHVLLPNYREMASILVERQPLIGLMRRHQHLKHVLREDETADVNNF